MSQSKSDTSLRRRSSTEEKTKDAPQATTHPTSAAPHPESRSRGSIIILASLCLALFIYFRPKTPTVLPELYALCSPDGANIYTVDVINPRVQCLVVRGPDFVDAGSVGTCLPKNPSLPIIFAHKSSRRNQRTVDWRRINFSGTPTWT